MTKTIINNNNKDSKIVSFKEIKEGDAFLYYANIYYKILYRYIEKNGSIEQKIFGVTPGFYTVVNISDDTLVIPVEEVSITYKI